MASATKETKTIVETVGINLKLSNEEASFLKNLLGKVGGTSTNSPRKYSDSIAEALDSVNVSNPEYRVDYGQGAVYYKDFS